MTKLGYGAANVSPDRNHGSLSANIVAYRRYSVSICVFTKSGYSETEQSVSWRHTLFSVDNVVVVHDELLEWDRKPLKSYLLRNCKGCLRVICTAQIRVEMIQSANTQGST